MVRDKITHVLFGKDVIYDATGIADVDAGEIIVIAAGTTSTNIAPGTIMTGLEIDALSDEDGFYLVEGKIAGNVSHIISPKLSKGAIAAHRGTSYTAPAEQVSYIGYSTGGSTEDINNNGLTETEYTMSVSFTWDKDVYSERHNVRHYSYIAAGGATGATIAAGFVALMNADANFASQAVAAVTNSTTYDGISITGLAQAGSNYDNPVQVKFNVATDLGFDNTVAIDEFGYKYVGGAAGVAGDSVSPTPGVGTGEQFKAMERNNIGFTTGQTNHRKFPIIAADPRIDIAADYDVYVIDYTDTHESADNGLSATRTTAGQIIVANDSAGATTTTALEVLFKAITGVDVNL